MAADTSADVAKRYARAPKRASVGPPVPLDAECAAALAAYQDTLLLGLTLEQIPRLREMIAAQGEDMTDADIRGPGNDFQVSERIIPGPAGAPDIPLLVCLPNRATCPAPVIYNLHPGGMITGNRRTNLLVPIELAREMGAAVVSVEYRLAPEHQHPAQIEDCYAGLMWTVEHASGLRIDLDRLVVLGLSAGGGLAASLSLLARDRGGPQVAGQMLLTPMLDDRNDTASALQNNTNSVLDMDGTTVRGTAHDRDSNGTCWRALLGRSPGGSDVSAYASAARAEDVSGLPSTYVDVGSAETFRDEAVIYASRIWQARGVAELHVFPGGYHGYDHYAPTAAISQATRKARRDWLHRVLAEGTPQGA